MEGAIETPWEVFGKEGHNREKREVAYTELDNILKYTTILRGK